ncbi:GntR family transcriptional regulator [Sulfobacillus thermosulfidooxidans]|uniref:GntR family transcriptional regulator n=1 Tax=Sulfobacillus thermosulfidooxidans TaxID=28034 RepID=UPI0002D65F07|nr:GntR family transcriptional regulator [Sulfobacillus thermosulfidooxidans]
MIFVVDEHRNEPLYMQLRNQVVEAIARNELRPGDVLPPIRTVAELLAINLHTVNKAYQILEQDGYIVLTRRSGGVIKPKPPSDFDLVWRERLTLVLAEARAFSMDDMAIIEACREILTRFPSVREGEAQ